MGALAARQQDLSQTIAPLPPLLRTTNSALRSLNASFGPTQDVRQDDPARASSSSVRRSRRRCRGSHRRRRCVEPSELGGLVKDLTPAVQETASTIQSTTALLSAQRRAGPVLHPQPGPDRQRGDPGSAAARPACRSTRSCSSRAVGIAGAGQNFDGNGRYLRSSPAGGSTRCRPDTLGSQGPLYGNAVLPPLGTRPAFPGQRRRRSSSNVAVLPERGARTSTTVDHREPDREARDHRPPAGTSPRSSRSSPARSSVAGYILEHQPSFTFGQSYYTVRRRVRDQRGGDRRAGAGGDDRRASRSGRSAASSSRTAARS